MATLTVWTFDTLEHADAAAATLVGLSRQGAVTIRDAATVSWSEAEGKPHARPLDDLTAAGALGGAFWGLLFGLIFFVPLLGAAIGATTRAFPGSLADGGIDDAFVNRVRDQITPGTSALFLMCSAADRDLVMDAFTGLGPSGLVFADLGREQAVALRQVFSD